MEGCFGILGQLFIWTFIFPKPFSSFILLREFFFLEPFSLSPCTRAYESILPEDLEKCSLLAKNCRLSLLLKVKFYATQRRNNKVPHITTRNLKKSDILHSTCFTKNKWFLDRPEKLYWDHPFSTYVKFSEKLKFLTPWYVQVRVYMAVSEGKKYQFFGKFRVHTKWMIPYKSFILTDMF